MICLAVMKTPHDYDFISQIIDFREFSKNTDTLEMGIRWITIKI